MHAAKGKIELHHLPISFRVEKVHVFVYTAEEEANSVKLQEEMMYQSSEHAVAIETLKADYENVLERTSNELKMKHEGEIALGKTLDLGFILKVINGAEIKE